MDNGTTGIALDSPMNIQEQPRSSLLPLPPPSSVRKISGGLYLHVSTSVYMCLMCAYVCVCIHVHVYVHLCASRHWTPTLYCSLGTFNLLLETGYLTVLGLPVRLRRLVVRAQGPACLLPAAVLASQARALPRVSRVSCEIC